MERNEAYRIAGEEVETERTDKGLWYRAFAEKAGAQPATNARYVELRVAQLMGSGGGAAATAYPPLTSAPPLSQGDPFTEGRRGSGPGAPEQAIPSEGAWDASPRPWRRFCARVIDNYLYSIVGFLPLAFVIGAMIGGGALPRDAMKFFENPIVAPLLMCPVAMVLEGLLFQIGLRPPGKALLGLRVVTKEYGTMPTFGLAANRVLNLWFRAMWGGIPLLALFGMAIAASRLRKNGETGYDESLGTRVEALPLTAGRVVGAIAVFVLLLGLTGIIMAVLGS